MSIHLDHLMVPARDKIAAARLLAELLGVPWCATGVGPFAPVFVNDGFTIDFDEWPEPIPRIHYCFRVSEAEFHAILARIQAAGIPYRLWIRGKADGNYWANDSMFIQFDRSTNASGTARFRIGLPQLGQVILIVPLPLG